MKERILTNWTFTRVLYIFLGIVIVVQSVLSRQWFGVAFGAYFMSMGLFAFGCASGSCFGGNCQIEPRKKPSIDDVQIK